MSLNPKQEIASKHINGALLILAGAGSGKTTVLAHRINEMEQNSVRLGNILCVTFTNKAKNELIERTRRMIKSDEIENLWISTFHALGLEILRNDWEREFSVAHTAQCRQYVKNIIESFDIQDEAVKEFLKPGAVLKIISLFKSELVSVDYTALLKDRIDRERATKIVAEEIGSKINLEWIMKTYKAYQKKLAENGQIDVDDILLEAAALFERKPETLEKYQNRFTHIMVDEYQDTNRAQYVLIKRLAEKYGNIGVVGDDSQSIFGFRGSDMRNIINFKNDYPDALEIKLEENYRSTQTILKAANQVISRNKVQKQKELFTTNEEGEKIKIHKAEFNIAEAEFAANEIKRLVEEKRCVYRDIAVFYRNNADTSALETVFPKHGVPYAIASEASFFERKEIKDIISYAQFIADPESFYHFNMIVNTPKRGIGKTTIDKIIALAPQKGILNLCENPGSLDRINDKTREGLADFAALIKKLASKQNEWTASKFIEALIAQSGYKSSYEDLESHLKKEKDDYLAKLVSLATEFEQKNGGFLHVNAFVKELAKSDVDTELVEEAFDRVQFMTVHSAKGLEFPIVFVIGMKEEGFPSKYARSASAIEEERRICYVAITRAKELLYLLWPEKRVEKGEDGDEVLYNEPSRFLSEFDQDLAAHI